MIKIKGIRYTQESFVERVKELVGDEYIVIGKYTNSKEKIEMKHNKKNCNKIFSVRANHFLNDNVRCPYCSKKRNIPKGINRNKKTNYSKERVEYIIDLYTNQNKSTREIQKIVNIDRRTISKILRENNISLNGNTEKHKKIKDDVYIKLFKEKHVNPKISYKELADKYNVPYRTISKRKYLLDQIKYDSRSKYTLDVNYFRKIETQDQAYILGFLMADGSVNKTKKLIYDKTNKLCINISMKDIEILEYIKKELKSNSPIIEYMPSEKTYGNNKMCKLNIYSIVICKHLEEYGIVPNKTGKEVIPKLHKNLIRHFIRGFFDGDGISLNNGLIGFCSNQNFLIDLKNHLVKELDLKENCTIKKDNRNKNIYYLNILTKDDCKKIKDYIYKDAKFYLKRKFENF